MSSFDGKLLKLSFACISPAPFCTILAPNIKSHEKLSLSVYFILLNIPDYYCLILLNLKRMRKALQLMWVKCFVRHPVQRIVANYMDKWEYIIIS